MHRSTGVATTLQGSHMAPTDQFMPYTRTAVPRGTARLRPPLPVRPCWCRTPRCTTSWSPWRTELRTRNPKRRRRLHQARPQAATTQQLIQQLTLGGTMKAFTRTYEYVVLLIYHSCNAHNGSNGAACRGARWHALPTHLRWRMPRKSPPLGRRCQRRHPCWPSCTWCRTRGCGRTQVRHVALGL